MSHCCSAIHDAESVFVRTGLPGPGSYEWHKDCFQTTSYNINVTTAQRKKPPTHGRYGLHSAAIPAGLSLQPSNYSFSLHSTFASSLVKEYDKSFQRKKKRRPASAQKTSSEAAPAATGPQTAVHEAVFRIKPPGLPSSDASPLRPSTAPSKPRTSLHHIGRGPGSLARLAHTSSPVALMGFTSGGGHAPEVLPWELSRYASKRRLRRSTVSEGTTTPLARGAPSSWFRRRLSKNEGNAGVQRRNQVQSPGLNQAVPTKTEGTKRSTAAKPPTAAVEKAGTTGTPQRAGPSIATESQQPQEKKGSLAAGETGGQQGAEEEKVHQEEAKSQGEEQQVEGEQFEGEKVEREQGAAEKDPMARAAMALAVDPSTTTTTSMYSEFDEVDEAGDAQLLGEDLLKERHGTEPDLQLSSSLGNAAGSKHTAASPPHSQPSKHSGPHASQPSVSGTPSRHTKAGDPDSVFNTPSTTTADTHQSSSDISYSDFSSELNSSVDHGKIDAAEREGGATASGRERRSSNQRAATKQRASLPHKSSSTPALGRGQSLELTPGANAGSLPNLEPYVPTEDKEGFAEDGEGNPSGDSAALPRQQDYSSIASLDMRPSAALDFSNSQFASTMPSQHFASLKSSEEQQEASTYSDNFAGEADEAGYREDEGASGPRSEGTGATPAPVDHTGYTTSSVASSYQNDFEHDPESSLPDEKGLYVGGGSSYPFASQPSHLSEYAAYEDASMPPELAPKNPQGTSAVNLSEYPDTTSQFMEQFTQPSSEYSEGFEDGSLPSPDQASPPNRKPPPQAGSVSETTTYSAFSPEASEDMAPSPQEDGSGPSESISENSSSYSSFSAQPSEDVPAPSPQQKAKSSQQTPSTPGAVSEGTASYSSFSPQASDENYSDDFD